MPEEEDLLPTPPSKGPPLPSFLEQRWPMGLYPPREFPLPIRLHRQREAIRHLNRVIAIYESGERRLNEAARARLAELRRLRNLVVARTARLARFRK